MSRLTERFSNGQAASYWCGENCKYDHKYCYANVENCPALGDILEKLAYYEDLEEQGKLIVAKYGKGQMVYEADGFRDEVFEYEITDHEVWHDVKPIKFDTWDIMSAFGEGSRVIFPTEAEAKAKLAEMKEGEQ